MLSRLLKRLFGRQEPAAIKYSIAFTPHTFDPTNMPQYISEGLYNGSLVLVPGFVIKDEEGKRTYKLVELSIMPADQESPSEQARVHRTEL